MIFSGWGRFLGALGQVLERVLRSLRKRDERRRQDERDALEADPIGSFANKFGGMSRDKNPKDQTNQTDA